MSAEPNMKVAVVTGGSLGIGLAIATRFHADGFRVYIVGRDAPRLAAAAESIGVGVSALSGDVAVRADVERIIAAVQSGSTRLDVLVNNAGLLESIPIDTPLSQAEEIFDRVVGANLKGSFLMSRAALPLLAKPGGRIINIGSIVAHSGGTIPGFTAYTPAKAGQHGLTLALARELGPLGITVNTVAPGFIEETGQTSRFDPERVRKIALQIPLNRAGRVDDVASAVAWLASAEAGYVTGMTLPVNGGWRFY